MYPGGGGGGGGAAGLPPRPHPRLPGQVRQQASLLLRPQEIHPVHTRPAHGGLCQKVGDRTTVLEQHWRFRGCLHPDPCGFSFV